MMVPQRCMRLGVGSSTWPQRPLGKLLALAGIVTALWVPPVLAQRPLGIDVSYWQGDLSQTTWNNVYAAGRTFAFIRCTHYGVSGGDPDPYFASNMTRARNAGLLVGTYHFARPTLRSPQTEADYFVHYATQYWTQWTQYGPNFISSGFLRPVLDLEEGSGQSLVGASSLSAWATAWLDAVKLQTGVDPIIYCNGSYANQLNSSFASRTLWFANFTCPSNPQTANPSASYSPWSSWTFWQYCSSFSVAGISPVDTDVFYGTAAQLQTYVIGGGSLPPIISNVQATNVTNIAATITWTTDSASSSQVQYGLTTSYGSSSPLDSTAVTSHSVALSGLTPNTLYHYRVISTNTNGTTTSSDYTLTTAGPPTLTGMGVSGVTSNSATITWTTNVGSTSQVRYGLTSGYGSSSALDSNLVTSHSVTLTGLNASTLYHYQAVSGNAYGTTPSSDSTFSTTAVPAPPVISNVASGGVTSTSATITWTTDLASDSQVEYGPTTAYGTSSALDSSHVTGHSVLLSGLTANTLYHYRARSANEGGTTYSPDYTLTTLSFSGVVTVDNLDPGFAYLLPTSASSWSTGTASSHYGADYFWAYEVNGTSEASATYKAQWTPDIPVTGTWDVYIWYATGSNRSTNTYWKIVNAGATLNIRVNEQTGGNGWTLLAADVPFNAGTTGNVQMWNNTGRTGSNRVVQGDAVQFVLKSTTVQPPTITQQPSARSVCPGATASFTVAATGEGTLSYQWLKNGSNLSNAGHYSGVTTTTLTIANADASDAADYRCVVTNADGSTNSNSASLSLKAATTITQQPQAQQVAVGGTATFIVAATGEGSLTYQWQKNGANVSNGGHYSGVTTATLTVSSAATNDVATYRCVVTGGCGSATSSGANLTLIAAPTITQHPAGQSVCPGGTVAFSVTATGSGTLTYQWQKNTSNLTHGGHYAGVATTTLTVSSADSNDEANYRCVVTNAGGSTPSNVAPLLLKSATTITQQPQAQTLVAGASVSFTVTATGDGTLTYQWYKGSQVLSNGGRVTGATSATLSISAVDISDAGSYRVDVTGGCGTVSSQSATLTVTVPPPPQITDAVSRKAHGSAGSFDINVFTAHAVECRKNGPTQVMVTFDQAIQQVSGTVNDVSVSSGTVSALAVDGSQLAITMSGASDADLLTIGFPGIAGMTEQVVSDTLCLGVLLSDFNSDNLVNIFDLVAVRNALNQPVTALNFWLDVTADGGIDIFDMVVTRNNLNKTVGSCP